jgi:hypothetical protein
MSIEASHPDVFLIEFVFGEVREATFNGFQIAVPGPHPQSGADHPCGKARCPIVNRVGHERTFQ